MASLVLFNKPYQVLSQFSDTEQRDTLAKYLRLPEFRVAGRLDYDSEGLLLLTDDGHLQQHIANPKHRLWKTYWVQVEGIPEPAQINKLVRGIELKDGLSRPAKATLLTKSPPVWPRHPPIRERQSTPTSWLQLSIREGRNRQVRRMTAAIGHPTLRLIRAKVGEWSLSNLEPGESTLVTLNMPMPSKRLRP